MFTQFFAKDNATAKLSSFLIVAASVLTLATKYFHFSPVVFGILALVSGLLALAGQFLQANKVLSRSGWYLFAYTLITYLAGEIGSVYPDAQSVVGFLGAVVGLIAGPFSQQQSGDPVPPKTETAS